MLCKELHLFKGAEGSPEDLSTTTVRFSKRIRYTAPSTIHVVLCGKVTVSESGLEIFCCGCVRKEGKR